MGRNSFNKNNNCGKRDGELKRCHVEGQLFGIDAILSSKSIDN
jgi:hypothetical protein